MDGQKNVPHPNHIDKEDVQGAEGFQKYGQYLINGGVQTWWIPYLGQEHIHE